MSYLVHRALIVPVAIIDGIGTAIFSVLKRFAKRRTPPTPPRRALFIRLEHIGDMVMATPAFASFKKSHPGCAVHVLCKPLTAALIAHDPSVDRIITYDAPWFRKSGGKADETRLRGLIKRLRDGQYDLIFEMHGDPRNNYLAWRAGGYCVGYACRGAGFLLDEIRPYPGTSPMIEQNLALIEPYARAIVHQTRLSTRAQDAAAAMLLMRRHHLRRKGFVILNQGSGRPEKDLTDEEADRIIHARREAIVLTGSSAEQERNRALRARHPDVKVRIVDLTGKTPLPVLVALVREARQVIAPDTGIVHIAHAVGTPCHAVYKTTDPRIWGYAKERAG